jgi:predicted RNase H-like HicB family nuclease
MLPEATHYTYRVAWSPEDGGHVATVAEFPSLSWLAPTQIEALRGIADVVRDVLADLAASGEPIPAPLSERTYSGRFVVRVPAEVHRRLAPRSRRTAREPQPPCVGSTRPRLIVDSDNIRLLERFFRTRRPVADARVSGVRARLLSAGSRCAWRVGGPCRAVGL